MKRVFGLSLPELMVSIAIVSVVGAGMYVGFQQIDSAQQAAREVTANANQTGLLLDLLESDTRRAGQGLDTNRSTCLVAPSGSAWKNSCNGDFVQTNEVSHGLVTCRKTGGEFISSLFFVSGPTPYNSTIHKDLRCGQDKGPFFDVYSVVRKSQAQCELPAISELEGNLRTAHLCKAEFSLTSDGANFALTTSGRLTSEVTNGSIFSFSNKATQTTDIRLTTADSLLETIDPYLVSFEQSTLYSSAASGTAWIRLDRPALEDLRVRYAIFEEDGEFLRTCEATVSAGSSAIEIPQPPCSLSSGQRIELLTEGPITANEITEFELQSASAGIGIPIQFGFAFSETSVGYGDAPLIFSLTADREIDWSQVDLDWEPKSPINLASAASASGFVFDDSVAGLLTVLSSDGDAHRSEAQLKPNQNDLGEQRFWLTLNYGSPVTEVAREQVWITSETSKPQVFFLQDKATAIRPITGEHARTVTGIIASEPPPVRETVVNLSIASGTCGNDSYIVINGVQGTDASCDQVTLAVGAERTVFEIAVQSLDQNADPSSEINSILLNISSGSGYTPQTGRDTFALTIDDYQVPRFDLANTSVVYVGSSSTPVSNSITVQEDVSGDSSPSGTIPIRIWPTLPKGSKVQIEAVATTNPINLSSATRIYLGTASNNVSIDPASAPTPITLNLASASGSVLPLPFWINNDEEQQGSQTYELKIVRASGDAKARRPDEGSPPSIMQVTVVDNDQCGIGGGMTIGDSRADDFHTVGLDDMTNENVTAATVRISSGYDSSNDILLIDGIAPTTATNITTYSGGSVTYNGTSYNNITSKFYTNQGVLEISRASALPAPAMVKFFNESVYFQSTASGNSARSATFTLGDAQAWDMHEDGTTHYYRFVPDDVVFFNTARVRAASASNAYFGVPGYLATVTSKAENTFLAEKFNDNGGAPAGWLGGWDRNLDGTANEGKWIWMNGPEAGRRFLSGNTTNSQYKVVRGAGNGDGTAASITRSDYQQEDSVNGSDHTPNDSFELWNMRYNEYSESITNGKVSHPSNPYRFSNFARGEPNNCCGGVEHYLQMTGNSRGGRLWNDLPDELGSIIGNPDPDYGSPASPYYVRGYYQEFGGPLKSEWGFYNRKFSQTNNFTTGACSVTKSTAGVGLTQDSCEAWSDLTIGTGTSSTSGFDFFGPNSSVNGQNISSARVSISSGYVSGTDELVIDGVTANTSTVGQKKYLNFAVNYNGTNYDNIDAIFFINQGVMEITRYTNANGTTKATMPASAMVKLFNELVEFVHNPTGNGLVSDAERQVTYTLGEAQAWFGHEDGGTRYYRYVPEHLTWWQARDAAKSDAQDYFGVEGYLATVTSKTENDFLADKFNDNGGPPAGWLNGRDWGSGSGSGSQNAQNEGKWRWVGGPESGRHFWKGNGTSGKFLSGTGNNAGTENNTTKSCVQQSQAWNGHAHASGYLHRLNYGYTETLTNGVPSGSVGGTNNARFANWSCYNSNNGMEPNNAGAGEDFLQLNGGARGGGMWNDLKHDQATGTGVYNIKGYYIEYGGPAGYSQRFSDRQLGATFRINPQECALVRVD